MIGTIVIFDSNYIWCNGFKMYESYRTENWHVINQDGIEVYNHYELEEAIKYCLDNS